MQTKLMLEWVRAAFPYTGHAVSSPPPVGATEVYIAGHSLVSGLAMYDESGPQENSLFRIGFGLNGLARYLDETGNKGAASQTFQVAYGLLSSVHERGNQPDQYRKAIGFSYGGLKRLGGEPLIASENLVPPTAPLVDLTSVLILDLPVEVTDASEGTSLLQPSALKRNSSIAELLTELKKSWPASAAPSFDAPGTLNEHLRTILGGCGILYRDLGELLRKDLEDVAIHCRDLPSDRESLQEAGREFRRFAFQAGDDEKERRRRWLLATIINCALWKIPTGLPTNQPQVMIDLMGYVGAVLIDRRYNDADRDLLLDSAETQVLLAHELPPVVFARFDFLWDWVLAAAGTYLVLTGPDPSSPSDSYYDERIQSPSAAPGRGLRRAERPAWPELLLNRWQPATDSSSAASHALASLNGWDSSRGRWLINLIFNRSRDEQRELSRAFWLRTLDDLLARVARVRIATNPWRATGGASIRGSMITTDEKGRFVMPDSVLRAAAAQGLRAGEIATVHGKLFQGRRVPTYLLTNRFGPYAIVKVDHGDKILREKENFETYARRLHQSHRPSECYAHPMDMYLGQSGDAVRAIETAYVFEERDEPLTLREWTARKTGVEVSALIKEFLLEALRPWLAHVRRDRVDLRAEYPVFRPGPTEGKQAPANWCSTELAKLEDADVCKELGVSLSRMEPGCPWLRSLPGAGAVPAEFSAVSPLWLAAEIAEIGSGSLSSIIDARDISLRDFDTLLSLCHGDLHLDNVLCASMKMDRPHPVLIDFESAHYGHVCKDIAHLEASLLCQVFEPDADSAAHIAGWFATSVSSGTALFAPPAPNSGDSRVELLAMAALELRKVAAGCGQVHWPIRYDEYLLAIIGALLPMVRYTTHTVAQRRLALLLSTISATYLAEHWRSAVS